MPPGDNPIAVNNYYYYYDVINEFYFSKRLYLVTSVVLSRREVLASQVRVRSCVDSRRISNDTLRQHVFVRLFVYVLFLFSSAVKYRKHE